MLMVRDGRHVPEPDLLQQRAVSAMATEIAGLALRNPVVLAAGTAGYAGEMADALDLSRIGAVTSKSITREPREGNAPWRIIPAKAGMLNAIGLANVGIERFIEAKLPDAARLPCALIVSVAGHSVEDYTGVVRALATLTAVRTVELNVSCPNTETGRSFGADADALARLLAAVRAAAPDMRLIVKLAPDADPVGMARVAIDGGAAALTLTNTLPAMAIDPESRRMRLSRGQGGLSGPAIHPLVVRIVHDVHRQVARDARVPIIGLGGVMDWQDAAEMILAGASAVGVGTALFADPRAVVRIADGLEAWVRRQGCSSVSDLVGGALP
jgi:dihydroorotate dehydrogenase (NAD+) catalytic subunit